MWDGATVILRMSVAHDMTEVNSTRVVRKKDSAKRWERRISHEENQSYRRCAANEI